MIEIVKFGDVPKAVQEGNEKALTVLLANIAKEAKSQAEVDTGQLRNSIMYRTSEVEGGFNDSGKTPADRKLTDRPKEGEGYVGSALLHAIYNEFGTRRMAAEPFLRPAVAKETSGTAVKTAVKKYQDEAVAMGMRKGPRIKKVVR